MNDRIAEESDTALASRLGVRRREMTLEELKLKWEMCLEKIEEQEGEIKVLERELNRAQSALTLISEGLNVLHTMGTIARPLEFEILFKDYAPFNNIMAHYFPKEKKARTEKVTK